MALIEREALIQAIEKLRGNCDSRFYDEAIIDCVSETISAPTIDPIEAAGGCYCRECKYWSDNGRCEPPENGLTREYTRPTDFCSYGELREAQDDG